MRKLLFIFAFLLTTSFAHSQQISKGIQFFKGTWKEAIVKAQKLRKPIFVYIYTDLNERCKVLDNEIFKNQNVSKLYNEKYVNYKIDAQKEEGIEMMKQYYIEALPVFLYFDTNAEVIFRIQGKPTIGFVIAHGQDALQLFYKNKSLEEYDREYPSQKNNISFLEVYFRKRALNNFDNELLLDVFLSNLPVEKRNSFENMGLIGSTITSLRGEAYDFFYSNIDPFMEEYDLVKEKLGLFGVEQHLLEVLVNNRAKALATQDSVVFEETFKLQGIVSGGWRKNLKTVWEKEIQKIKIYDYVNFYQKGKNWSKYRELIEKTANDDFLKLEDADFDRMRQEELALFQLVFPEKQKVIEREFYNQQVNFFKTQFNPALVVAYRLNTFAWGYFENIDDKIALNYALKWSNRSIELDINNANYHDTYACLLFKLDRKEEAIKKQEEVIAKQKANGGDTKQFEENLTKMKDGTLLKK
jgi:hypothetical protein